MVVLASGCVGVRSMGLSVMLKSPSRRSGCGVACDVHAFFRGVQKAGCLDGVVGA
jgi:hypothetical protein